MAAYNSFGVIRSLLFVTVYTWFLSALFAQAQDFDNTTERIKHLKSISSVLRELPVAEKKELSELYFRLAQIYQDQNRLEEAVIAFRKAKALGYRQANIDYHIGNVYYRLHRFETAEPFLKSFCDGSSNVFAGNCKVRLFDIYSQLGADALQLSFFDRAIDYFRLAELNAPDSLQKKMISAKLQNALFQKATYYFSQKNYLEAAHFFLDVLSDDTSEKLKTQTERIAGNLFINAGKHYEKVGEPLKSLPFYRAIVKYFKAGVQHDYAQKRISELAGIEEELDKPPAWLVGD